MKRFSVVAHVLLLAGLLPGCLENPLFDDEDPCPPPPGLPNISGYATMESATFVTHQGGTMTMLVHANNARGVEMAYDVQGEIVMTDGSTEIGRATFYIGDIEASQSTETFVDVPITAWPNSATIELEFTWWDQYDYMYQRQIGGYVLFKAPV